MKKEGLEAGEKESLKKTEKGRLVEGDYEEGRLEKVNFETGRFNKNGEGKVGGGRLEEGKVK